MLLLMRMLLLIHGRSAGRPMRWRVAGEFQRSVERGGVSRREYGSFLEVFMGFLAGDDFSACRTRPRRTSGGAREPLATMGRS